MYEKEEKLSVNQLILNEFKNTHDKTETDIKELWINISHIITQILSNSQNNNNNNIDIALSIKMIVGKTMENINKI